MAETVRIEIPIEVVNETEAGASSVNNDLKKIETTAKKAQSTVKQTGQEVEKLDSASGSVSKTTNEFKKMDSASKQTQSTVKKTSQEVSKFDKSMQKTKSSMDSWLKQKYELLIEAKDKISPILQQVQGNLKSVSGKVWSVTTKVVDKVTSPVKGILRLLKNPIFQAGAILGITIGIKDTVDTYKEFEATMSEVKALADANDLQMVKLTNKAKEMGAATKFSGTESAQAFTYMAQAGWTVNDMMDGISGVMDLAAADNLDLASTTDIVANALTAFGLKAKDSADFANVLAVAAAETNTDVAQLGESFKYVAPVAGAMNYNIRDVSTALGIMSNNAIKGSQAGTTLKTALANMAAPSSKMEGVMTKYGISLTDAKGNMKSLAQVMDNLRSSLGGLSETEQTAAATRLFGKESMAGMLSIINASQEDYDDLTNAVYNSDGAAARMAETLQDNLAGAFESMGGSAENLKLTLGERLKPHLIALAKWIENSMPMLESFVGNAMDYVDDKVANLKKTIDEFTASDAWENADMFGKIKIAWDEIIAKPFGEWWSSKGQAWFANKAESMGKGIGTGISTGILALLGIDVSGVVDEGAGIGASFAKGFADGFASDEVKEKLSGALKGIFANAATILPGGKEATASSFLSAMLVGKLGGSVFKAGKSILSLGGGSTVSAAAAGAGVAGSTVGGDMVANAAGVSLGSRLLGSRFTGKGILGNSHMLGSLLGSQATGGALTAVGLGAGAGGIVGAAGLISGIKDLYSGFKTDDESEATKYKARGGTKIGMVGAGAAAGAAIGSVVPVLGTVAGGLIGAGIGGLGALFGGNKVADSLSGANKEMEGLSKRTEELNSVTGEMKQQNLDQHFGKIALSMDEVKKVAGRIIETGSLEKLSKFSTANSQLESMQESHANTTAALNQANWKLSMGFTMDESELEEYQAVVESFVSEAQELVNQKQYTVTLAIQTLVSEKETRSNITTKTNEYYEGVNKELKGLNTKLTKELEKALSVDSPGGAKITVNEQKIITDLQSKIESITKKISDSEFDAKMEVIKFKYEGGELDSTSFAALQTELGTQVEEATAGYDEALEIGISNAKLMLKDGAIDQKEYDEMIKQLQLGYSVNLGEVQLKSANFQIDTLMNQFSTELETANLGERANKVMGGILEQIAANPANGEILFTPEAIRSMLGVDNIDADTQVALSEMFTNMQPSIEPLRNLMDQYGDALPEELHKSISESLANADLIGALSGDIDSMWSLLGSSISNDTGFQENLLKVFNLEGVDIPSELIEKIDIQSLGTEMSTAFNEAFGDGSISPDVSGAIAEAINATDKAPIFSAIDILKQDTGAEINKKYSQGFETTTDVLITANYKLANPIATIDFSGGGSGSATVTASIGARAEGGFTNGPEISWVGEDGPEAIIPLGSKRRSRGLSLWEKAGEILGVQKHAEGGIINLKGIEKAYRHQSKEDYNISQYADSEGTTADTVPVGTESTFKSDSGKVEVKVDVSVNPTFEVSGSNSEGIIDSIKANMVDVVDEIGGELAKKLEEVFSNMPVKEVG